MNTGNEIVGHTNEHINKITTERKSWKTLTNELNEIMGKVNGINERNHETKY